MTSEELNEKLKALIMHCTSLTVNLVRLSEDHRQPEEGASGFLVPVEGAIYLVSAGHALKKNRWVIETTFTIENEFLTACIPLGAPWTVRKFVLGSTQSEEVDIGWAKIDLEAFQNAIRADPRLKGKKYEYTLYQGPTEDGPNPEDPHIYAAMNRARIISALGRTGLERELSYEYEMEFKGIRSDGLYTFSIPEHKGHKYYYGASGSPIIEPTGKVVAVLVKGCEQKNELYGFPMRGLAGMIKAGIDTDALIANGVTMIE